MRTKKPFPAGAAVLLSVTVSGIDDRLALRAQVGEGGAPDTEAGMTLHFDLDAPTRTSLDSFAACVRATLPAAVGRSLYLPGLR